MRRKRRGRFRREVKRATPDQFAQSLELFADQIEIRPEDFRPAGLPNFGAMLHRCTVYPDFAAAFAQARSARIGKLCELGIVAAPLATRGRAAKYDSADYARLLASIETSDAVCKSHFFFRQDYPAGLPTYYNANDRVKTDNVFAKLYENALLATGWSTKRGERTYWPERNVVRNPKPDQPEVKAGILDALRSGESLKSICANWRSNGLASKSVVYRWLDIDSEFAGAARAIMASDAYCSAIVEKRASGQPTRRAPETSRLKSKLLQNTLFAAAESAIKGTRRPIDPNDRFDVIADMIEAALAGELEIDDMPDEASWFISEHYRRMSSFAMSSLDKTISNDGEGETYMERLTSDDYGYAE